MTFSLKNNDNTGVVSHELGHMTLFKSFMENNPNAVKLVDDMVNWVGQNYKKLHQELLEIEETYKGKSDAYIAEEKLAKLSEYMRRYDLKGDRTIYNKIFGRFQKINDGKNQIENGKDVFDMIGSFNNSFESGELTGLTKKISESEKIKQPGKRKTTFSKTEENRKIKDIFDEFTGPAENRKFKSKEEFKNSPEFFEALLEIEQSNTLDASIRNTVSQAYLNMNPGFIKEVKERISDKYQSEYDASKNSLFGWLTGKNKAGQTIIQLAAGDIQTKKSKQPTTVTTTKKVGGEESKVTVGEMLVSDEISPEDYADIQLTKDKLKKIKPQQSKIAKKIDLSDNEINLAKRDIISFLRKTDRPAMTDPKKFFKALVDYTTGKGVQPGGFC